MKESDVEDPQGQADVCCQGVYSKTIMACTQSEFFWCRLLLFLIRKRERKIKSLHSLEHLLLAEIVCGSFFHACALWVYFFLISVMYKSENFLYHFRPC